MRYINENIRVPGFIYNIIIRLHLILHAVQGKPIIYGCTFISGVEFEGSGVYVANNKIGDFSSR